MTSTDTHTPPTSANYSPTARLLRSGAIVLRGPLPASMACADKHLQNLASVTRSALDAIAANDATPREKRADTARVIASARTQFTATKGTCDRVYADVAKKVAELEAAVAEVEQRHSSPVAIARLQARAATLGAMDATAKRAAFDAAVKLNDVGELLALTLDGKGPASRALARAAHPQLFDELARDVPAVAALRVAAIGVDRAIGQLALDPDCHEHDRGARAVDLLEVAHGSTCGIDPAAQLPPTWSAWLATD
jgi:hypothetical protein